MNSFRENIITIRKAKSLSQYQMAIFLRIPPKTYQSWEEGRARPKNWISIADRLSITVDDLMRPKIPAN